MARYNCEQCWNPHNGKTICDQCWAENRNKLKKMIRKNPKNEHYVLKLNHGGYLLTRDNPLFTILWYEIQEEKCNEEHKTTKNNRSIW